jgi:ketosteroid isomerase-like protein
MMRSKEEKEVLDTITEWNTHFAKNETDKYFKFLSDDVTLFIGSSPYRIEGVHSDREEFEYSLKQGWSKVGYFQMMQMDIRVYGQTAVATYHTRGSYGTDPKIVYVKETNVLVKQNGQWKIVHIHVSPL